MSCTVGCDACTGCWEKTKRTFARPRGIGIRLNDFSLPRKMEFKGWVTDYKQWSYQRLTETEVSRFIMDLHQMVPDQLHKFFLTGIIPGLNKEPGQQSLLSVCGSRMRSIYRRWSECWTTSKKNSRRCPKRHMDEKSPPDWRWARKGSPWQRPMLCFAKASKRWEETNPRLNGCPRKIRHVSLFRVATAAKYTPEGEGLAREGWNIKPDVLAGICVELSEALFLKPWLLQADEWVECSDSNLIAERLLGNLFQSISTGKRLLTSRPSRKNSWDLITRKRTPTILSVQETKSWDVPNLELQGFIRVSRSQTWVCNNVVGFWTFHTQEIMEVWREMYSNSFRNNYGDGSICSNSKKSLEMYENCIPSVVEVLWEGRKCGARDFYITSDFNVALGLMCTDENDNEELLGIYGPLCWQGYVKDPGGFKKNHVVWDHERIWLQGILCVICVWKRKRRGLYAQTHTKSRKERRIFATGLHQWASESYCGDWNWSTFSP